MGIKKFDLRDRGIADEHEAGSSVAALAERHGLTEGRISAIINHERNRRELSPDAYYRAKRQARL